MGFFGFSSLCTLSNTWAMRHPQLSISFMWVSQLDIVTFLKINFLIIEKHNRKIRC